MQCGKSVFAASKSAAKRVAKKAGGNMKPVGPEIDEGKEGVLGYYYHYHTYNRKPKGNHAFFSGIMRFIDDLFIKERSS